MIKNWIFIFLICIPGLLVLLWLGSWQLQRLAWKENLINEITTRLNSDPRDMPTSPNSKDHNYYMTKIEGQIQSDSIHILTSTKKIGPGFRVISTAILTDGRPILVDRGIIPEKDKNLSLGSGKNSITGYLLWPNETDYFTPEPNLEKNIWFARDLEKMANFLRTEKVLIVATKLQQVSNFNVQDPTINIPNNHLQYAITWFLMGILWLAMTVYFFLRNIRKRID